MASQRNKSWKDVDGFEAVFDEESIKRPNESSADTHYYSFRNK